jgi:hypothetical protein
LIGDLEEKTYAEFTEDTEFAEKSREIPHFADSVRNDGMGEAQRRVDQDARSKSERAGPTC